MDESIKEAIMAEPEKHNLKGSIAQPTAVPVAPPDNTVTSSKTLKRCLSVPLIKSFPGSCIRTTMTTRSAAAAAAMAKCGNTGENLLETPKKYQNIPTDGFNNSCNNFGHSIQINIPRSNPSSREVSPAPGFNLFGPRTRRYSASCTTGSNGVAGSPGVGAQLCLTPRVSQLRQEECIDMNSREVNHEREVHSAMQMSQSWEDLTLVAENWSCKSDEFSNPLQVVLPSSATSCSSPSPTSTRAGLRLPCVMSPSPTRRTFATRRSMSPIAMRPSQLGPVKRKFELDDNNSSNWNVYSSPPMKKIFTESRGSSPSSVCPSPDSGTYDGRVTPKLFISKLCTNNNSSNNHSGCSSPISASPSSITSNTAESVNSAGLCSSSSSSISGGSEPMSIISNLDEGISVAESYEKMQTSATMTAAAAAVAVAAAAVNALQPMQTDVQDDTTIMDDMKSETSSIGGCSSISIESTSCESVNAKITANFLNKLVMEDANSTTLRQKSFFINKQGVGGAKKFIVNHDNLQNNPNNKVTKEAEEPAEVVKATTVIDEQ